MSILAKKSKKVSAQKRRTNALTLLQMQLDSKLKTEKGTGNHIPLTDSDIKRMNKEIDILRERIK